MQAERKKASMESTGKSIPSSEGSSERFDFNSEEGSSSKQSRRGKRKKEQRCNKKWHEGSPDLEVPLTINEEVSRDADEPPEKGSREEETIGDGMILPLSLSVSFLS